MDYLFRRSSVHMRIVTGLMSSGCVELELATPSLEESRTGPLGNAPKLPWGRAPKLPESRMDGGELGIDLIADADANSPALTGGLGDHECVDALMPGNYCSSDNLRDAGTTGDVPPVPASLCNGCVALSFPANVPSQAAMLQFRFPEPGRDFSVGVVTWRLLVPSESVVSEGFFIQAFAEDSQTYGATGPTSLSAGNVEPDMWWDYAFDLSTYPPATSDAGVYTFDNKHVRVLNLIVGITRKMNVSARILVDSISFPAVSDLSQATFGTGLDGLVLDLSLGASDAHLEHFPEH